MPFDKDIARKVTAWFPRYLQLTKGEWNRKPFELLDWQRKDVIQPLFGTVKDNGMRRIKMAYIEVPKKNGKSPLAAGIALRLFFADNEPGAEIYSAACDKEQAGIVFDTAAEMVRRNKKLNSRCKIVDSTKRIIHENKSIYRVLSADVKTKHGFNPHAVIFDELHAQPNRQLWDVLTVGTGAARRQPLILAITTAGWDRNSICWELHERARKIKEGVIDDPSFLPVLYGADDEDDWTDEEVWYKCNPSLGPILKIDEFRDHCNLAQELPSEENNFRRFRLNQWTRQETRYIPMNKWRGPCAEAFDPEILRGQRCYAGLDLASINDLAAFVMVFGIGDVVYVLPRFWVPQENIEQRSRRGKVPYDLWARQGFITATPGNTIDYDYIENEIEQCSKDYRIEEIAYDRWGSAQIIPHLQMMNLTVLLHGQGWRDISNPTKELLRHVLRGSLRHGDNPVLTWNADNLMVITDAAACVKPDKQKSSEKIDGVTALIMALGRLALTQGPSVYESRGVISL